MTTSPLQDAAAAWILRRDLRQGDPGAPDPGAEAAPAPRIWGLTPTERLERALARAGCAPVRVVDADAPPPAPHEAVVIVRGDVVMDARLLEALARTPDALLATPALGPVALHIGGARAAEAAAALAARGPAHVLDALKRVGPAELAPAYSSQLRKRQPPWVEPARPERARALEDRLFDAAYKGATDLVTKWLWPRPAAAVTRWCAARGVSPNAVTLASWALAGLAIALFAAGAFGAGLLAAWAMTFLDTVDGKLARVTLASSRLGHVLDHGLDLIHPPFWYLAWGVGLGAAGEAATAVCVGGYLAGRLLEGAFLAAFGFEIHSWRPLDTLFRTVTARRNPNLVLLSVGALGGRPDLGLAMVALWTVASLGFHAVRLAQAFRARRAGERPVPWAERAFR